MKLFRSLALIFLLAATALAADDTTSKLDKLLHAYHDVGLLNGVVLVADHGTVIYKSGFGYANFEWQVPNTPDTKFRIGSVTKPFTAILVLQQVEAGKIKLDAPVTEYLPEYRADTGARVTVRQLLTHTSGIPTYKAPQILEQTSPIGTTALVKKWCSGDLEFEPGTGWGYNNCGYLLLGMILERTTGKTYADLLRDGILKPAEMNDSGVDTSQLFLPKRGYGYEWTPLAGLRPAPYNEISTALGAGDIYSTAEDMFRFDRALYGDKLLSAKMRELMFTPATQRGGLGWFIRTAPKEHPAAGHTLQFHEGHMFGFFTMYTRAPETETMVLTIDNTDLDSFEEIQREILSVLYHGTYTLPKKPIAREFARALREQGMDSAVAEYRTLKRTKFSEYDFDNWRALNRLGYALLHAGETRKAAAVFALNLESFPNQWQTWDSAGEGLAMDGQREAAIAHYKKSLELNPANKDGEAMLKKLVEQKVD
jgi:CubicO group peptidase (beta-lactamase class C family)